VSIPTEQAEYVEKHGISLSRLVQDELGDMMGKRDPHRHLPTEEIMTLRRNYLTILGLGVAILLATMAFSPHLLPASRWLTIALFVISGVVTVYGAWEYGYWHGILRRRAKA